jgi:hypothetical protein
VAPAPDIPIRLSTRWADKPDGPLPSAGDEGVPLELRLTESRLPPSIRGGALVSNLPAHTPGAAYVLQELGARVARIGARFGFGPGESSGSVGLIAFTASSVLNGHCHMVFTPDRWIAGIVADNGVTEIRTQPYRSLLAQDGRPVVADVRFLGTTVWIAAPDGTAWSLTDPRFGSANGVVACWEFYKNAPSSAGTKFYETWAG